MKKFLIMTAFAFGLTVAHATASPTSVYGEKTYAFLTHAAFFSLESKQPNLLDPQVFVADPAAIQATGPQNIVHIAGYRPAFGVEDATTPIYNAEGKPLGLKLGAWFSARGIAVITPSGTTTNGVFAFAGLIPDGHYSLFENHFSESGVTFTPLDGTGTTNSFVATHDGNANIRLTIPGTVTHAEGLLLVYHSDGMDHGMQRGQLGITAHHQLIVRVP